ncbi:hypothetical protein G6F50_018359 [Rhizopus delemar]|uniref:Uncharacterized protein n=1 Tax=Rhizopus delemar TaxID=936053 RepID=A0A9P6XNH4_9FUNG|nr:hypothetical protein G6F50_018359 [Rhizopus delemar]
MAPGCGGRHGVAAGSGRPGPRGIARRRGDRGRPPHGVQERGHARLPARHGAGAGFGGFRHTGGLRGAVLHQLLLGGGGACA